MLQEIAHDIAAHTANLS